MSSHDVRSFWDRRRRTRIQIQRSRSKQRLRKEKTRRYGIVIQPPFEYLPQPYPRLTHLSVHAADQLLLDSLQKASHSFGNRFSTQAKLSFPGSTAIMRKSQEVERLWTALTSSLAVFPGETPEFYQTCPARVQTQPELLEPLVQFTQKTLCLSPVLETHHEVVRIADDVYLPLAPT